MVRFHQSPSRGSCWCEERRNLGLQGAQMGYRILVASQAVSDTSSFCWNQKDMGVWRQATSSPDRLCTNLV